jgi:hypothetical protein
MARHTTFSGCKLGASLSLKDLILEEEVRRLFIANSILQKDATSPG